MPTIQKASVVKRLAAFLLDMILTVIIAVGVATLLSVVIGYDQKLDEFETIYTSYCNEHGIARNMSEEEYDTLSDEKKAVLQQAYDSFYADSIAMRAYRLVVSYTLIITIFSILISILVLEFVVPLILKNGRTLGKKIFGICLMQTNGVKITTFSLFARSVLGKYVLETMIPVLIFIGMYFGAPGGALIILIPLMFVLQVVLFIATPTNSFIHDIISYTVVVDYESQRIFATADDLIEYQKEKSAEEAVQEQY